jgi:hypothetical protein
VTLASRRTGSADSLPTLVLSRLEEWAQKTRLGDSSQSTRADARACARARDRGTLRVGMGMVAYNASLGRIISNELTRADAELAEAVGIT